MLDKMFLNLPVVNAEISDSFKRLRNSYNIRLKPLNPAPNLVRQVSLTGDKNVGLKGVSQGDLSFIKSPPYIMEKRFCTQVS